MICHLLVLEPDHQRARLLAWIQLAQPAGFHRRKVHTATHVILGEFRADILAKRPSSFDSFVKDGPFYHHIALDRMPFFALHPGLRHGSRQPLHVCPCSLGVLLCSENDVDPLSSQLSQTSNLYSLELRRVVDILLQRGLDLQSLSSHP